MAAVTSGSFNSSSYGVRYLTFEWSRQSYSVENNTTTIKWTLKGGGGSSPGYYVSGNFKVTIDGKQVYFSSKRIQLWNSTVVATGTYPFNHDNAGNKSFTVAIEAGIYTVAVNVSGSASYELPTIPRASSPTASGTFSLGSSITINTNRASSSFTHTLRYKFGSASGTIATGVTTSRTWTIPKTLANQIPSSTSGTLTIYCDTYSGSKAIGTKSMTHSVSIPNTAEFQPTITGCTLSEYVSGLNAQFGSFIQSRSRISGSVSASGAYSSTIKNYSISINGATYKSNSFTTDYLVSSGNQNCVVTVTDTRGRSKSATYSFNVLAYVSPTISTFTIDRCDSDGTLNDEGEYYKAVMSASITSLNNKNTKSFYLKYKKQSDTEYTDIFLSDATYTIYITRIASADVDSEYDFKIEATDYFTTTSIEKPLSSAFTLINFNKSGRGIAFGKVSSKDAIEINMDIYDKYDLQIRNGLAAYDNDGASDPNTSLEELILTNHANGPGGNNGTFYYIKTMFYQEKNATSNRTQIAFPYSSGRIHERHYYNGTWSNWIQY